jgi:hypothetical protein
VEKVTYSDAALVYADQHCPFAEGHEPGIYCAMAEGFDAGAGTPVEHGYVRQPPEMTPLLRWT